ncbi:hypothetical protein LJC47_07005 [Desulfosarcina sp. OttesenSCG-928-B08]|nr:hypothetical protein [Desulfosarcina sp. OttesenSCG-928-B08]
MTNHEELNTEKEVNSCWRHKKIWIMLGIFIGIVLFLLWYSRRVPLPTDEEMIAHFEAHRAEFDELVWRHRTFVERENWPELTWPSEEERTQQLTRQVGIRTVNYLSLLYWLPDPYSLSTAQKVQTIRDACYQDWGRHSMDKEKIPPPKCRLQGYQYGVLQFSRILPNGGYHTRSWRYVAVWKDYLHFPEPPRIEQGHLLGPIQEDGQYGYKKRIFTSLNIYPPDWRDYECVYRPIDAHWFIRLCNGH